MRTAWAKVESFLWYLASAYVGYVVYALIVDRPKEWRPWGLVILAVIVSFWWTGLKGRLSKFLRESLRQMIAEELQNSRIAFATWLREDAPWRGENPFSPKESEGSS